MRSYAFRVFAVLSMLALLLGAQLCMIVNCSPKATRTAAHSCCAAAAARQGSPAKAPIPDAMRPCCMASAITATPQLEAPAASPLTQAFVAAWIASLADAAQFAATPAHAPPRDESLPAAPPRLAVGLRAPPLA